MGAVFLEGRLKSFFHASHICLPLASESQLRGQMNFPLDPGTVEKEKVTLPPKLKALLETRVLVYNHHLQLKVGSTIAMNLADSHNIGFGSLLHD